MITEGVIVLSAAMTKLKAAWRVDGRTERACNKVVYEAMTIGGKGAKSDAAGGGGRGSAGVEGW